MRKAIIRTALTLFAVLFLASQASAAPIRVGWLQWDSFTQQFSVVNQTGVNWQGDTAFPVVTQLLYGGLTLTVTPGGVLGLNLALDNISYDSDPYAGAAPPTMATLTGSVSPLLNVTLDSNGNAAGGQSLYNLAGPITDISGGLITLAPAIGQTFLGDDLPLVSIYVDGTPVRSEVPEPATMFLLGSGAVGLLARRRRSKNQVA